MRPLRSTTLVGAWRRILPGCGAVAFWLLAWQVASMAVGSGLILAGPVDAAVALVRLVPSAEFWRYVGFSALRIIGGAAAGYIVAFALAAAAWRWRGVRTLLHPALTAIKGTPVACVVVMLLIWFGSRNVSAIAVFLMVLPGVYFPVLTGLDGLGTGQRELFCVFGAGRLTRLLALVWPGVLPYVTAASSTVLGMSWKAGVAAELIGVPAGSIGERIYQAKLLLETADLFAWTIVVVLISWVFERVVLAALQASWPAAGRVAVRHARRTRLPIGDGFVFTGAELKARELSVGHEGVAACAPVSFEVSPGQILCVRGRSGAGKTTLLRTLAGLQTPLGGTLEGAAQPMAAVFQDTRLIDDLTAAENVALFGAGEFDEEDARVLLAELLPPKALDVPVRKLSGGQRRRVELVRALAAPASLILLDEPFTGLDAEARRQAIAYIQNHQAGRIIVLSTHNPSDVQELKALALWL